MDGDTGDIEGDYLAGVGCLQFVEVFEFVIQKTGARFWALGTRKSKYDVKAGEVREAKEAKEAKEVEEES